TMRRNFDGHALGAYLKTNSLGFRGPEWAPRKPDGSLRVALVGDSHAFGFGVEFDEGVGQRLAAELTARTDRPCEVLNVSLPGFNTHQELAALRGYALPRAPDLVVVLICENDHDPQQWCDEEGWLHLPNSNAPGGSVRAATHRLVTEKSLLRHSRLAMYLKLMWRRATLGREMRERAEPAQNWMQPVSDAEVVPRLAETVFAPLVAMVEACRERGVPIVVVSLAGFPDYRRMMRAVHERLDVPTLELMTLYPDASSWSELSAKHGLGWDDHLDAASHAMWARAIADLVVDRGLVGR
ncbi:MAG: hypothetical protein KDB80_00845, partial [Planctomycetes bacterium]|nr:hypothetical protein [Planctomycetota bacterium]